MLYNINYSILEKIIIPRAMPHMKKDSHKLWKILLGVIFGSLLFIYNIIIGEQEIMNLERVWAVIKIACMHVQLQHLTMIQSSSTVKK